MSDDTFCVPANLVDALRERITAMEGDEIDFPIRMAVNETEEVIRILWEFVGHMGDDVGAAGYEHRLLDRARALAEALQSAMLAAMIYAGPQLVAATPSPAREERL